MEPAVSGDTAICRFLYMPYKTGAYLSGYPAGSHTVNSLHDAKVMAQSMIDGTEIKVKAIYDYIIGTVSYDFRYYSERENMPYESTVAIGALRDNLAICGGYAQAFETLLYVGD